MRHGQGKADDDDDDDDDGEIPWLSTGGGLGLWGENKEDRLLTLGRC